MNKLTIIGNLTRDPELKTVGENTSVCTFTVAVNRRTQTKSDQPEADFFRVTAWRQLGENCQKYLAKGRKACVIGPVSVHTYEGKDGQMRALLEVTAQDVEFLSPVGTRSDAPQENAQENTQADFTPVDDSDLPF